MSVPDQGLTAGSGPRPKAARGGAARRARAMASVAAGELMPGETIEFTTVAELGSFKPVAGGWAAGAAVGVATAVATGIGIIPLIRRRRYGVMLTNRRLLFIEANQRTGRFLRVAGALPLEQIRRSPAGQRVYLSYSLLERATGQGLYKLSFPLPNRRAGLLIAAAIPEVATRAHGGRTGRSRS